MKLEPSSQYPFDHFDSAGEMASFALKQVLTETRAQQEKIAQATLHEQILYPLIQRIRQDLDGDQVLQATAQEVLQGLHCDRVALYRFLADWSGEFIYEAMTPGWRPFIDANCRTIWQDTYLQDHQGGRYRHNQTTVTPNIYQASYPPCYLEWLEEFQIKAFIVVPIFIGNALWGLLGVYQNSDHRVWQSADLQLLEKVGDLLGVALQQSSRLQELEEARAKANTANQAKGAFIAHMSHELRTPLNAILGFSQLMSRDQTLTPKQQEILGTIHRSGKNLLNLINDVLEMSQLDMGQTALNLKDFDLKSLLASLHEMFYLKAQSKGLDVLCEYNPNLPCFIRADEGKLRQILFNLLNNAIKFTPHGQIILTAQQRISPETCIQQHPSQGAPCHLDFTVEDTGLGITEATLASLNEMFTQTAAGFPALESKGLGLSLSRQLVHLMGGDIKIQSQIGRGTKVEFSIQAKLAAIDEPMAQPFSQQNMVLAVHQPQFRILVVEDHLENRQLMVELLEWVGFDVKSAQHGQEALEYWLTWHPHLIWMDWQMPIMDGVTATSQIRQWEAQRQRLETSSTPQESKVYLLDRQIPPTHAFAPFNKTVIIALTASALEKAEAVVNTVGFDGFVQKPFQENDLLSMMTQKLGVQYNHESLILPGQNLTSNAQTLSLQDIERQLSTFPTDWLSSLLEASVALDEDVLVDCIDTIRSQHLDLAQALEGYVKKLQLDVIANCTQQAIEFSSI